MKKFFSTILFLCLAGGVFAQNGYNTLGIAGSLSANNAKTLSLQYEFSKKGTFAWGLIGEVIYYSYTKKPIDFKSNDRIGAGGLFLKWRIHTDRNFNIGVFGGAAIGSDNSNFIWYPFAGFQQNFYVTSRLILFTEERLSYLINVPHDINWHPAIKLGVKLKL